MKNKILQLFLLLGLTIGINGLAQAQSGSLYRANIPFDFSVNGKSFKAGEYAISFGFLRDSPASFLIRSADGKETVVIRNAFPKEVLKPNRNARIVFDKDGDNYALAEIKSLQVNVELYNIKTKQKSEKTTGVEISMVRK